MQDWQESKGEEMERKELEQAAAAGDAEAQSRLANMYFNGQGVAQDHALAHEWCLRAAEQGHADAQFLLGIMYELGLGVERNLEESGKWIEKAAAQGQEQAVLRLRLGI